jgi:hypothetical protein
MRFKDVYESSAEERLIQLEIAATWLVAQYRYVGWTVKHFDRKYQEQKGRVRTNFVHLTLQREGVLRKKPSGPARIDAIASATRWSPAHFLCRASTTRPV